MKKHPRFNEYLALVATITSFLAIPISIWIFVDAYLANDNFGKFRGIILTMLSLFHLILYAREYRRIIKRKRSESTHTYVD